MEFKDITVCRTCFSDESSNNMVPLINKSEQKLTCYGLSLVKFTQIKISVLDNLPQFMCKMCLLQLNQSIQFKLRCEIRNDTLNKLVKILQNEYTDKSRLQEEIVQHAMLLNSNILSPEKLSSSIDLVSKIQKSQTTLIDHKNSVACMSLPKKASKLPIVLSKHDELLMTIESLYNCDDKPSGPTEDVSYCESVDELLMTIESLYNCDDKPSGPTEDVLDCESVDELLMTIESLYNCADKPSGPTEEVPDCESVDELLMTIESLYNCADIPSGPTEDIPDCASVDELLMTIESLYNCANKPPGPTEDVSDCESVDELLMSIESLYSCNYKPSGSIEDEFQSVDDENLQDNISPNIEKFHKQLCRYKKSNIPSVVMENKAVLSQSSNNEETLALIDKMLQNYPKRFSAEKPSKPKEYICKICNKVLTNRTFYKYHCKTHKNMYRFICEHCGKGFQFPTDLNLHTVALHKTGDYIQCKKCPFKAARPILLKEHERLHTGERPFSCDKCGLTFRRQAIHKNHMKYHKEKTVQCTHCTKKFINKWHLKSHINSSHKRLYLYVCPICGAKYARNTTVRKHLLEKHAIQKEMQSKITRITL